MTRTTRALLGIAATTATAAALLVGVPATANAATTTGPAFTATTDHWGPYYSTNYKAYAKGTVDAVFDEEEDFRANVHITGKVVDRDPRTKRQGGKCALVRFQVHKVYDEHDSAWVPSRTYRQCGYPKARHFAFGVSNVDAVRVQVCQVKPYTNHLKNCSGWKYIWDIH
ncbi:hypothetical protein [Rhizohabitans arisaemae]|uniref:hypothetical protein n=1 Tax=Rhizohabitans arisaemae TaxID=2720610 RepID=UPI0024B12FAE|nr:hypothetical protein [Rhizohabitans arisaemae]